MTRQQAGELPPTSLTPPHTRAATPFQQVPECSTAGSPVEVTVGLYAAEATSSSGGASQQAIRFPCEFEVLTKRKRAAPVGGPTERYERMCVVKTTVRLVEPGLAEQALRPES